VICYINIEDLIVISICWQNYNNVTMRKGLLPDQIRKSRRLPNFSEIWRKWEGVQPEQHQPSDNEHESDNFICSESIETSHPHDHFPMQSDEARNLSTATSGINEVSTWNKIGTTVQTDVSRDAGNEPNGVNIAPDLGWSSMKSNLEAQMPQKVLGMNYQQRFKVNNWLEFLMVNQGKRQYLP